jgi:hypothetical protein
MTSQAPIKVNPDTKERIRYLATLTNLTQGDVVDLAVKEFAVRHPDMIEKGLDHARSVLAGGPSAIAAHLLDGPPEAVQRVANRRAPSAAAAAR